MDPIRLFLLGFLAVLAALYGLHCHALATIARKTGQGALMEVLAWLPGLQLIPTLRIAGVTLRRFLLHLAGFCLSAGALFAVSALLEGERRTFLGVTALGLLGLLACLYLLWIQWRIAAARNLPGWLGLLAGVPGLGLAIHPVIAFHDGWARPHPVGGLIGLLTALAMLAPAALPLDGGALGAGSGTIPDGTSTGIADRIDATATDPRAETTGAALESGAQTEQTDQQAVRALFELQGRFATLVTLAEPENMRDPDNRGRALRLVQSIRAELEERRSELDAQTYDRLAGDLVRIEGGIDGRAAPRRRASGTFQSAEAHPGAVTVPQEAGQPAALADGDGGPRRPFPVTASESCPAGTELRQRTSEQGEEEWCQQLAQYGGLRHGWYVRYFEDGRPEQVGEYRDGLRVGVWTRFHASGAVRAQAEFRGGLQHGWLLSFDERGERQQAVRFQQGVALR